MKKLAAVLAFLCFLFVASPAHAQTSIQFRDGSGTVLATFPNGLVIFKEATGITFSISSNTVNVSAAGSGAGGVLVNGHTFAAPTVNFNGTTPTATTGWQNGIWQYQDSGSGAATVEFPFCTNGGGHTGGLVPDPGSGGSSADYLGQDCTFHAVPVVPTIYYQTVQLATVAKTQRPVLNFSSAFTVADDSGNGSTDVGLGSVSVGCGGLPTFTGGDTTSTGGTCTLTTNAVAGTAAATIKTRSFGTTFGDTTGNALTSGSVVYFTVPFACTIAAWNITVDAGTVTFDVWKIATGTAIPTVTNTITASAKPALSTGTALHSTSMSGWTTSVAANDIFGIQLNTVATAKYAEIDLQCGQ